jgi:hypothetical protein
MDWFEYTMPASDLSLRIVEVQYRHNVAAFTLVDL